MAYGRRWRRLRVVVPLALLVMILMRLVWMQLRSYPVVPDLRASVAVEEAQARYGADCGYDLEAVRGQYAKPEQRTALSLALGWIETPGNTALAWVSCRAGLTDVHQFARFNQWMLAATVIAAALLTRFITSSWTVSLIVAAMLLSRGRLLADLGRVSSDSIVFFCVTAFFSCLGHYIRTGSRITLTAAAAVIIVCSLVERAGLALALVMPVALLLGYLYRGPLLKPVVHRVRSVNKQLREFYRMARARSAQNQGSTPARADDGDVESILGRFTGGLRWLLGMEFPEESHGTVRINYERGSLFRTISVPFLLWAYARGRWLRLVIFWGAVLGIVVALSMIYYGNAVGEQARQLLPEVLRGLDPRLGGNLAIWHEAWSWLSFERVDLHYIVSIGVILLCAVQSPTAGLNGFLECAWLALIALFMFAAVALGLDFVDAMVVHELHASHVREILFAGVGARPFLLWLEPVILTLGVAGVYNLMKVFDTRIAEKT